MTRLTTRQAEQALQRYRREKGTTTLHISEVVPLVLLTLPINPYKRRGKKGALATSKVGLGGLGSSTE